MSSCTLWAFNMNKAGLTGTSTSLWIWTISRKDWMSSENWEHQWKVFLLTPPLMKSLLLLKTYILQDLVTSIVAPNLSHYRQSMTLSITGLLFCLLICLGTQQGKQRPWLGLAWITLCSFCFWDAQARLENLVWHLGPWSARAAVWLQVHHALRSIPGVGVS